MEISDDGRKAEKRKRLVFGNVARLFPRKKANPTTRLSFLEADRGRIANEAPHSTKNTREKEEKGENKKKKVKKVEETGVSE